MFVLAFALISNLFAGNIHQAECIVPRTNPTAKVGTIYLHGWFDFSNTGSGHNQLEASNRRKLQALADRTGKAVAVPVSNEANYNSRERSWLAKPPKQRPSARDKLTEIEAKAAAACGGRAFEQGLRLVGFSDGGYFAREAALECATKSPKYSAVLMAGAQARPATRASAPNCAKLYAVRGVADDSTNTCLERNAKKQCIRSRPFGEAARSMINGFNNGALLASYPGQHELPPVDSLMALFAEPKSPVGQTGATPPPVASRVAPESTGSSMFSFGSK